MDLVKYVLPGRLRTLTRMSLGLTGRLLLILLVAGGGAGLVVTHEHDPFAAVQRMFERATLTVLIAGPFMYFAVEAYLRRLRALIAERTRARDAEVRAGVQALEWQRQALDEFAIVAVTDEKGTITYANDRACRISGYSRDELLGQDHRILNSGTHPREFFADMWAAIGSGRTWRGEICNRAKDGALYWVDTTIVPLIAEDGRREGYISIRVDITARKRLERELAVGEQRHALALDASRVGVWEANLADGTVRFDQQWCEMLGLPHASIELTFDAFRALILTPGQRLAAERALAEHIEGRADTFAVDYQVRHADGRAIWLHSSGRVIGRDASGAPLRLMGTHVDITERKRAEEQLAAAKALAEEAAQAKSAFLARMSHEIRTPMNAVLGFIELTKSTRLDKTQAGYIDIAERSAEHLLGIIDEILDFSKLEAQRMELEAVPFDLRRLVSDVRDMLQPSADAHRTQLALLVDGGVPARLRADPTRLRQVLVNLVGNAIKFTQGGRIEVRVRVDRDLSSPGKATLAVEVVDTGVGLHGVDVDALFEPYQQADVSTTRQFGGTGLGLAICRDIVGLMDGEIGARANPTAGATFWLRVPVHIDAATAPATPAHVVPAAQGWAAGLRVLVVDDVEVNRRLLESMLLRMGCTVALAEDGGEALRQLEETPFDLVLLDCFMPALDGCDVARALRAREARAGLPHTYVLALTASTSPEDIERCRAAGMDGFLAKPVRMVLLEAEVASALARVRGR